MNPDFSNFAPDECSSIQVDIVIDEAWIDDMLDEHLSELKINEQYTLINIRISLGEGTLNFQADLKEKEGTSLNVTSTPVWDPESQKLRIENLDIHTDSKNFLLKSAGWLAQTFLTGKIDSKVEEQANRMIAKQIEKLKSKPLEIPLAKAGTAKVTVSNIVVHQIIVKVKSVQVRATIDAFWNIHLIPSV